MTCMVGRLGELSDIQNILKRERRLRGPLPNAFFMAFAELLEL